MNDIERFFGCKKPRTDKVPDPYLWDLCNALLPSAKNYFITDIDMVVRDRDNNFMLIEVKRRSAMPSMSQRISYQLINAAFMSASGSPLILPNFNFFRWQYYGFHLLQFENTSFEDGAVYFDKQEVTLQELVELLSFRSNELNLFASNRKVA